jgi:hypothetical protein
MSVNFPLVKNRIQIDPKTLTIRPEAKSYFPMKTNGKSDAMKTMIQL